MKGIWQLRIYLLAAALLWGTVIQAQSLPIIPQPRETQWLQGHFPLSTLQTLSCYWPDYADSVAFRQLREELEQYGIRFRRGGLKDARLLAGLWTQVETFPEIGEATDFIRDSRIGEEGYHLIITPQNILLLAQTNTGLFYGVQTLRQLLRAYGPSGQLPCLRITDFPAFAFRGVLDDISHGPIPNLDFLKRQIRRLSELKINYLNFYIEHVVAIPGQEGFAPPDALTLDEWTALSEYAGRHHLHLVGGFQSLGHAGNILAQEDYRRLGQTEAMFKPADPDVQAFLLEVYEKMLPAFNSGYFNINCDEAFELESLVDRSPETAYIDHVRPLLSYLIGRGKQPLLWADMLHAYPELLDELPKGAVLLPWNNDADADFAGLLAPFRERELPFIACPDILNANRLLPQFDEALANIGGFVRAADSLDALGILTTVWDDGGHSFFTHDWYAVAYAAGQSWRPNRDSIADFDLRFSRSWMGDRAILLPRLLRTLNQLADVPPTWGMQDRVLRQRLVPNFGESHRIDTTGWAQIEERAREAQRLASMLERTAMPGSYAAEDQPYWRLVADIYHTLAETRFGLLQMNDGYREAAEICATDSAVARDLMKDIFVEGLRLSDQWGQLRKTLERLWLMENRAHALDSVAAPYAERQQRLRRLAGGLLVMSTANDPKDGSAWLSPRQIGLEIVPLDRPYFTQWMISTHSPSEEMPYQTPAFLAGRGHTGSLLPDPGAYYRFTGGRRLEWTKYDSPSADWVDFGSAFAPDTSAVVFAYCRIFSPSRQSLPATLSYDGRLSLWLDGESVYEDVERDNPGGREKNCTLPLEKGVNHLLLRIEGHPYNRRFALSLPEHRMGSHKHQYFLLDE